MLRWRWKTLHEQPSIALEMPQTMKRNARFMLMALGMGAVLVSCAAPVSSGATVGVSFAASGTLQPATSVSPGTIPPFPSVPADAATSIGTFRPGDMVVIADTQGPAVLVRVRAVRLVPSVPGLAPASDGDIFLEATVDVDVLRAVSDLPLGWKTFGAQDASSATWPARRIDLQDLTPGIRSGEVGFEAPSAGQVLWRILNTIPSESPQFELRPVAEPSASASGPPPAPGDWTGLVWSAPTSVPESPGGGAAPQTGAEWRGRYAVVGSTQGSGGTGAAAVWLSNDGTTWTQTFLDDPGKGHSSMQYVVAAAGGLVGIGTSGVDHCTAPGEGMTCDPLPVAIWTSIDGRTWRHVPTPASFQGAAVTDMAAGPSGILAIGDTGWDRPWIWSSPDGRQWTRESMPAAAFEGAHLRRVAAASDGWALVGSVGGRQPVCCAGGDPTGRPAAWYSSDGTTWTRASTRTPVTGRGELGTLSVGSGGLVAMEAVGGASRGSIQWISSDGRSWVNRPWSFDVPSPVRPIASDGARMVWAGSAPGGPLPLFVSTDGRTWRPLDPAGAVEQAPTADGPAGPQLHSAILVPDGLVVFGFEPTTGRTLIWIARAVTAP